MIILHGFASSNFYNAVKHVLMHKGIAFNHLRRLHCKLDTRDIVGPAAGV